MIIGFDMKLKSLQNYHYNTMRRILVMEKKLRLKSPMIHTFQFDS